MPHPPRMNDIIKTERSNVTWTVTELLDAKIGVVNNYTGQRRRITYQQYFKNWHIVAK